MEALPEMDRQNPGCCYDSTKNLSVRRWRFSGTSGDNIKAPADTETKVVAKDARTLRHQAANDEQMDKEPDAADEGTETMQERDAVAPRDTEYYGTTITVGASAQRDAEYCGITIITRNAAAERGAMT